MNKRTIYIHLGYPKTATTTLQESVFSQLNTINYLGKFNPKYQEFGNSKFKFDDKIINHIIFDKELLFQLRLENFQKQINDKLVGDYFLISEENFLFASMRPKKIRSDYIDLPCPLATAKKLRMLFPSNLWKIKIILTIRRQDEMVLSQYVQSYSNFYSLYFHTNTWEKFLNFFTTNQLNEYYAALNYWHLFIGLSDIFGEENIKILIYEDLIDKYLLFCDQLSDFLKISESDKKYLTQKIQETNLNNSKIDNFSKNIKNRTILQSISFLKKKYNLPNQIKLPYYFKKIFRNFAFVQNNTIKLSLEERNKILSEYKDANRLLSKHLKLNLDDHGYF